MTRDLSERTKRLLRSAPDECGMIDDRCLSAVLMSVVHGMIAAGWDQHRIIEYFQARQHGLAPALRQHYLSRLSDEVSQAIASANGWRSAHEELCGIARRVVVDEWRGAHSSAFRTLWGLYGIAEIAGDFAFTASRRQVSEAAGLGGISDHDASYATAARAVSWLERRGLIGFARGDHSPGALNANSVYCLHAPTELRAALVESQERSCTPIPFATRPTALVAPTACTGVPSVVAEKSRGTESLQAIAMDSSWNSPLWEPAGLGATACRVWHLLAETEASSVKLIAGRLGVTAPTARNALAKLQRHGLVTAADGGFEAASEDVDALAEMLGLADRPQRRAKGNQHHRSSRERYLLRGRSPDSDERLSTAVPDSLPNHVQRATDDRTIDYETGEILEQPSPALITVTNMATGEVEHIAWSTVYAACVLLGGTSTSAELALNADAATDRQEVAA